MLAEAADLCARHKLVGLGEKVRRSVAALELTGG
jgi:hypothetical protein